MRKFRIFLSYLIHPDAAFGYALFFGSMLLFKIFGLSTYMWMHFIAVYGSCILLGFVFFISAEWLVLRFEAWKTWWNKKYK